MRIAIVPALPFAGKIFSLFFEMLKNKKISHE